MPHWTQEELQEDVFKQLIKEIRPHPKCAGWTDAQFRDFAEQMWEERLANLEQERQKQGPNKHPEQTADPHPGPLPERLC